jgi:threonyl-tRNA synthetase
VDERDETVGKRIRDAELEKIPKVVVYGDRESDDALAVRDRGGNRYSASLVDLASELATL